MEAQLSDRVSAIWTDNQVAKAAPRNSTGRRTLYTQKAQLLSDVIVNTPANKVRVSIQQQDRGELLLVTISDEQRISSFHIPFHRLTKRAQGIVRSRLGWRAKSCC